MEGKIRGHISGIFNSTNANDRKTLNLQHRKPRISVPTVVIGRFVVPKTPLAMLHITPLLSRYSHLFFIASAGNATAPPLG